MAARSDDVSSASSWPPETDLLPAESAGQPPGAPAQWDSLECLGAGGWAFPPTRGLRFRFVFSFS